MKRKLLLALCTVFALCLALAGCVREEPIPTSSPAPSATATPLPSPTPTAIPVPTPTPAPAWTEEDAYAAFQAATETAGVTGWTPAGCAAAEDRWGELGAVVLYTDESRNNACNLAYLYREGGIAAVGFAANASDETRDFQPLGAPVYLGEGKVAVDVKESATGKTYRFTVSNSKDGWNDFTVESAPLD